MTESSSKLPEVWLRGPVPGVPALVQPIAHALLQAREEVNAFMIGFPGALLWEKPFGAASVGFHLQHLTGVLDRLFTYANGDTLNPQQLSALAAEGIVDPAITVSSLLSAFHQQVEKALRQLQHAEESCLTEARGVGRAQLPSTVIGLLTHAAEHTMRHTGQLNVTVKVVKGLNPGTG